MRLFIAAIVLVWSSNLELNAQDSKIHWMSVEEVTEALKDDPRPIMMDVYTAWCGPCKMMMANTFTNKDLIAYVNKNYYSVKFDAETRDTIVFNNHTFANTDPTFVKTSPNARGRAHWFAQSLLESQLSYPSYAILDDQFTRLAIYPGFKQPNEMLGILLFFGANQYQQYHNYLNGIWNQSLKLNQDKTDSK